MATVITAINPLTGEREAISPPISATEAPKLAEKARRGGLYKDVKITSDMDNKNSNKTGGQQLPGALPQATANGLSVDIDRTSFALALKTWRLRHMYTQDEVGKRWGVSRYTIIKAERGKQLSWETAYRLFVSLSREMVNDSLV